MKHSFHYIIVKYVKHVRLHLETVEFRVRVMFGERLVW
jgi:hypothetical protein